MSYIYINNFSQKGKMGISLKAIDSIASKAVREIPGAEVYDASFQANQEKLDAKKSKKRIKTLFTLPTGVYTTLSKAGKAVIKIDVALFAGCNVPEICTLIQKHVADAISLSCDTIPYEVKVHVVKIIAA